MSAPSIQKLPVRRGKLDLLAGLAVVFFMVAVFFAAAPAFRADAATYAGLLLLVLGRPN